jgi:hypothetical protein
MNQRVGILFFTLVEDIQFEAVSVAGRAALTLATVTK